MGWHRTNDRPLFEQMIAKFIDTYDILPQWVDVADIAMVLLSIVGNDIPMQFDIMIYVSMRLTITVESFFYHIIICIYLSVCVCFYSVGRTPLEMEGALR